MKKFFKLHAEWVLIAVALVLIGAIIGGFMWSITFIAGSIGRAVNPAQAGVDRINFNLDAARKLDFHGLREATSSADAATTTASSSAP